MMAGLDALCGWLGCFAIRTNWFVVTYDVFFTAFTKWATDTPATPTRVGREEV